MRTGLTKQEKTTDIWFDEKDPFIHIRTHNTDLKNRLTAYAGQHPDQCRQTDADPDTGCMEFEIRKGRFSFRLTAPYSEERRRAASKAAKKCGVHGNADAAVTQSASAALAAAMADSEKYIHDNKELLEHYRAVVESEEYKASPAYRLQEYLKQFQRESGYNDVFIPAMQRLSPAYREYHKSLQAANEVFLRHFQQE